MADMPERIQVGPFSYAVTTDPAAVARIRHEQDDGCYALTDHSYLKITMDADFPPDQVRDSLLHEVMHAVIRVAGRWQKGTDEETAVQKVTGLLLDTLRRNPSLSAYLLAEDGA